MRVSDGRRSSCKACDENIPRLDSRPIPGKIILEGVVGSHAYGLNTATSDVDTAGVFVSPLRNVLSLNPHRETISRTDGIDKDDTPDYTFHEIKKYLALICDSNPTAMELLWLDGYETLDPMGALLVKNRHHFLSQLARVKYGGYARGQLKRLKDTGNFGSDLKKRKAKNARHLTRLVIQGKEILETGNLTIRLSPENAAICWYMSELVMENEDEFVELAEIMLQDFEEIKSDLPERPNMKVINKFLYEIRMHNVTF